VNLLDLLLIVIIGVSAGLGFAAGFARAGIGFAAVIAGILFGFWFYGIPAAWFQGFLRSATLANILGFLTVFFGFQLAGGILGKILSKLFKWTGLTAIDRVFGAGFGLVRGALMAVAFVAVLMAFTPKPIPNWMVGSAILPYAIDASDVCASLAPKALKDAFRDSMKKIRRTWDEQVKRAREGREREAEKK
jgi:membrane protein required for colicin V production